MQLRNGIVAREEMPKSKEFVAKFSYIEGKEEEEECSKKMQFVNIYFYSLKYFCSR